MPGEDGQYPRKVFNIRRRCTVPEESERQGLFGALCPANEAKMCSGMHAMRQRACEIVSERCMSMRRTRRREEMMSRRSANLLKDWAFFLSLALEKRGAVAMRVFKKALV